MAVIFLSPTAFFKRPLKRFSPGVMHLPSRAFLISAKDRLLSPSIPMISLRTSSSGSDAKPSYVNAREPLSSFSLMGLKAARALADRLSGGG